MIRLSAKRVFAAGATGLGLLALPWLLGCAQPAGLPDAAPLGPGGTVVEPVPPAVSAAQARPCHRLVNLVDTLSVRGFGGVTADGHLAVLASGGPSGDPAPMTLDPQTGMPIASVFAGSVAGRCRGVMVTPGASWAAAVCNHDPVLANPDSSDEVFLLDLRGSRVIQTTDQRVRWNAILAATVDASGERVAYLSQGSIWLVDLRSGSTRELGPNGSYRTGELLRLDQTGQKLLVGDATARTVTVIDVAINTWRPFSIGARALAPDGDLSADGGRVVFVSSEDLTGKNPTAAPQIFTWDAAHGVAQLTSYSSGSQRMRSVRMDAAGRRVAFLAYSPPDGSVADSTWSYPHVAIVDLPPVGETAALGPFRTWPLGQSPIDLQLTPAGDGAYLRVTAPGRTGIGMVRVDLPCGDDDPGAGTLEQLLPPTWAGQLVGLSRDGRLAIVEGTIAADAPPVVAIVPARGGTPTHLLPWGGTLAGDGDRVVAMRDTGSPGLRQLTWFAVEAGVLHPVAGATAATTDGGGTLGAGDVAVSADGRRALFLSSQQLLAEVPGSTGRYLYRADLDTGQLAAVLAGLDQTSVHAALDAAGDRVLAWRPRDVTDASGVAAPGAELVLRDLVGDEDRVLYRSANAADADGEVALTETADHAAFCASFAWDAVCRLMTVELGPSGTAGTDVTPAAPVSYPGLDVAESLSLSRDGRYATFVGAAPGMTGLIQFDSLAGQAARLQPSVMTRAFVGGETCGWSPGDGGAIVALPEP